MGDEKVKKLIAKTKIYRALAIDEMKLKTAPFTSDPLSEASSRPLRSSGLRKEETFLCCSEDIRRSFRYSQKVGYSGEIAVLTVLIYDDGSTEIEGMPKAIVKRLWHISDWVQISASAGGLLEAENLNYSRNGKIHLFNILNYSRGNARAYARSDFIWIIASPEEGYEYTLLTKEEKDQISTLKKVYKNSGKYLIYKTYLRETIQVCNMMIEEFDVQNSAEMESWKKYTIRDLKKIRDAAMKLA